jgi:hypothetical protein
VSSCFQSSRSSESYPPDAPNESIEPLHINATRLESRGIKWTQDLSAVRSWGASVGFQSKKKLWFEVSQEGVLARDGILTVRNAP